MGAVLDAANLQSEIEQRVLTGELTREQTNRLRRLAEFDVPLAKAELEAHIARTEASRESATSERELRGPRIRSELAQAQSAEERAESERVLRPEQIAAQRANIAQSYAAAASSRQAAAASAQAARQSGELFPLQKRLAELESRGYEVGLPSGEVAAIPGKDIGQFLLGEERIEAAREARIVAQTQREAASADARLRLEDLQAKSAAKRLEDATHAESNLLSAPVDAQGRPMPPQALVPYTDVFNANSEKDYVYIPLPAPSGFFGLGAGTIKFESVPIPQPPGQRYSAKEIYAAAIAKNKSVKQYLEEDIYRDKLRTKAPWLP